jgi:alkylation response protein AidB-like acyl-CoA dehydrogenase
MPIGVTEEHVALGEAVAGWAERHCPPAAPRALLDAPAETPPPFWSELGAQGWLGLHVAEAYGGSGYGVPELVVVVEELGRVLAPGPFLASTLAAAALERGGNEAAAKALLPGLAVGETVGAIAFGEPDGGLVGEPTPDGLRVSGTLRPVLGAHLASVLVAPVSTATGIVWCVLDTADCTVRELASVDPTRRLAEVVVDGVEVAADRQLPALDSARVRDLTAALASAELVGVAQWCVTTAAEYAKVRVQFGRPIGQFQGVKHKCADMVGRVELARAAAWDAARAVDDAEGSAFTAAAALALAVDAAFANAKDCIQVLGGIGFTWEHDAHMYMKRAITLQSLLGPSSGARRRACELALAGTRRRLTVDLGPEADELRAEIRSFIAEIADLDARAQRVRLADAGYIVPTWPPPWGRAAKAVEQLVIEEEFRAARVNRPNIMIGSWALPPVILYGTAEQQQRWIPATLRGDINWCQLFSEPGAGSDLASLSTRATRVEGGWMLNGQKVWTSAAQYADWGILLARTNPDAPKHDGISCFMLDMKTPGIDVRPLRELTGESLFNEVFFDDAFIPDDCLVGQEHDGWRAARTTLANERVFMGSGLTFGHGLEQVLKAVTDGGRGADALVLDEVGGLVTTAHALGCLGFRLTLAALAGADPSGSEASVRKLLGVVHDQHVQEVGLALIGVAGAIAEGEGDVWSRGFLFNRNLTIAGGTSEVQRNIIGERVLGLPRDP